MLAAAYFFMGGILLCILCGFRLQVRFFQWIEARRPWKGRPAWDPTHLLLAPQLRDTLGWEIAGLTVGIVTVLTAVQYLQPA
jgi:hypothetical protein